MCPKKPFQLTPPTVCFPIHLPLTHSSSPSKPAQPHLELIGFADAGAAGLAALHVMSSLEPSVLRLDVVVSGIVLPHRGGKGLFVAPLAPLPKLRLSVSAVPRLAAAASEVAKRLSSAEIAQSDPLARGIDWAVEEVEAMPGGVRRPTICVDGTLVVACGLLVLLERPQHREGFVTDDALKVSSCLLVLLEGPSIREGFAADDARTFHRFVVLANVLRKILKF